MAKAMGITASENSIYWGLKYVLFYEGIVVSTGQTKDKQSALLMRNKLESDVLPTYQT